MSRASGNAASRARSAASESSQVRITVSPCRSALATPRQRGRARRAATSGQRGADRLHADPRLDLGRRTVGHDRGRGPSARCGRRRRRPLRGSAWRTPPSCRRGRSRASSTRTRAGPRRRARRSARRARADRGRPTIAIAKRTRWVWPPDSFSVRRSAMSARPVIASTSSTGRGVGIQRRGQVDELADRELADERAGLEHRRRSRRRRPLRPGVMPNSDTVPLVGPGEPEQHVDGGRLAGAVRAEDGDGLARRDVDVDAAHGVDGAERLLETGQRDPGPRRQRAGRSGGVWCAEVMRRWCARTGSAPPVAVVTTCP